MKIVRLIQAACATTVLAGSLLLWPAQTQAQTKCTKVWVIWSAILFEECTQPSGS
jgi:hypothetical protein